MENFRFRNELADKLKEIRKSDPENPEFVKGKAQGYLDAKKETAEYKKEKEKFLIYKQELKEDQEVLEEFGEDAHKTIKKILELGKNESGDNIFTDYRIFVSREHVLGKLTRFIGASIEIDADIFNNDRDNLFAAVANVKEKILQNQEELLSGAEKLNSIGFTIDDKKNYRIIGLNGIEKIGDAWGDKRSRSIA